MQHTLTHNHFIPCMLSFQLSTSISISRHSNQKEEKIDKHFIWSNVHFKRISAYHFQND